MEFVKTDVFCYDKSRKGIGENVMSSHDQNATSMEHSLNYYFRDIQDVDVLSQEEEIRLALLAKQGDKSALDKLVGSNLKLVISIACEYKHRGVMIHDLIEEGNVGLMEAAHRYDPDKGCRFSTYASWWIKQKILKAIMEQTRTIRLPVHVIRDLTRIMKNGEKIAQQKFDSHVTVDEISHVVGLSPEKITELIRHRYDVLSLDQLLYEDSRTKREDSVRGMADPHYAIEMSNMISKIHRSISCLSRVDQRIVKLRYGMDGRKPRSIAKISGQLGVSREYVSRSLARAHRLLAEMIEKPDADHRNSLRAEQNQDHDFQGRQAS